MNITATPSKNISLTLDLNLKEAMVLRAIFGAITGAFEGPRNMSDQIYEALEKMDVPSARIADNSLIHLPDSWDAVVAEDE